MTRAVKGLLATAAVLSTTLAAQPVAFQPTLFFSSTQAYDVSTPFSAAGGTGTVDFTGSLTTGNPCYDVTGSVRQAGQRVTVTVSAQNTGGICAQVITHNNYEGTVSQLDAGTYDFRIVHQVNGSTSTAYTQQVTVS